MNVETLLHKAKTDPDRKKIAAQGFKHRLEEREARFFESSKKRIADENFFARSYNL
jgi:hypothetical protein